MVAVPAAVGALVSGLVFVLAHRTLIDDAYITVDYARTLAEHGVWGMQPQLPGNAATSPLNVLLLAAVVLVTGRPVLAAGVLLVVALAATGAALGGVAARLERGPVAPSVAVALVAVNPLLVSVIGMETQLAIALAALLALATTARRPALAGVVCGLLLLTRADLVGFCVAAFVAVLVTAGFRAAALLTGVTVLVGLPWYAAAWFWLGSAVPDTLVIKTSEGMGDRTFANGLWYFYEGYPLEVTLSLLPALLGVLVLLARLAGRRGPADHLHLVLGVGGLLHAGTYLLLGTGPYQWYYGPAIGTLTLLGVMGASWGAARVVAVAAGAALLVVTGGNLVTRSWTLTTITGNWATPAQYAELALRAPPGAVVRSFGEVGTVAYFCRCTVADRLSDRGWFGLILHQVEAKAGPAERAVLELDYRNFHPPAPLRPTLQFTFARDPGGVPATSWRGDQGEMVIRPVP